MILNQLAAPLRNYADKQRILTGRHLSWHVRDLKDIDTFADIEFSVFSQFGDDGIIQWLLHRIALPETFVEFGVGNYREANTRFLLVNNNWRGLVMDSDPGNIKYITRDDIYWRHHLAASCNIITTDNINDILTVHGYTGDIGILHIDIDGNDYWVWKAVTAVRPAIAIIEYNSVFGPHQPITIPYDPGFARAAIPFSHLYFGASLPALCDLATAKGYDFVGCNTAGNNAYFIRSDVPHRLTPLTAAEGYVQSKFSESRNWRGRLTYIRGWQRNTRLHGVPVINTRTGEETTFDGQERY